LLTVNGRQGRRSARAQKNRISKKKSGKEGNDLLYGKTEPRAVNTLSPSCPKWKGDVQAKVRHPCHDSFIPDGQVLNKNNRK